MLRQVTAIMAMILCGCGAMERSGPSGTFRLCSSTAGRSTIRIEYDEHLGFRDHVGRPITRCVGVTEACIEFPIVLTVPPRYPANASDEVRWSSANYRFTLRASSTAESFDLDVTALTSQSDNVSSVQGRGFYRYHPTEGIVAYRVEGVPHRWTRCAGRLTFDDLEGLLSRSGEAKR